MQQITFLGGLGVYLLAFACFLVLDFTWLGPVAGRFYREEMNELMRQDFNWVAAISFYLLFVGGLCFFVIFPAIADGRSMLYALGCAAIFWLVTYATYDLTGLAVIRGWSMPLALLDMAWGTALSTLVAGVTIWAVRFLW